MSKYKPYTPKFKVGDVIEYIEKSYRPNNHIETVLEVSEFEYKCLVTKEDGTTSIDKFDMKETDMFLELHPESIVRLQFKKDLDALLKE